MAQTLTWSDDKTKFRRLQQDIAELGTLVVTAGVHGNTGVYEKGKGELVTMPQLAAIHEFGATEAGKSKTVTIPARSFIGSGLDAGEKDICDAIDKAMIGVVEGTRRPKQVAALAGVLMEGAIKARIGEGIDPALAESTRKHRDRLAKHGGGLRKLAGRYTPLHETGQLLQSVTHKVATDDGEDR